MTMQCIAHRGGPGHDLPENSLAAITRALTLGCAGIEIDVWQLHGELYIIHDHRLGRVTNGNGALWTCSREQLDAARLENGEPILTLQQVLELVGEQCLLNIEIKNAGATDNVIQALQAQRAALGGNLEHILLSSFNHHELFRAKQLLPQLKRGVLLASDPLDYAACAEQLAAYSCNTALVTTSAELSSDIQRRGLKHWVYTANYSDEWQYLNKLGVDAVFTDQVESFMAHQQDYDS
ncbi:glycerophosphodiester phosphodiesterase [Gilvimarinus polysaccharolyticus]|uniref:glycerophosphodiester phosphodiesterase n=1 Tax=Gilvimarinus polysaccharolyticus TaxID=863921 RepID=UPI000673157A|nr:glycerophosphodiester phosphodiesterase [Gilvimarinus polysaccharolyticus]